ncbi:hypothetical protein MPER_04069 [Moniliophthora perniciosa FA553]|nr:hypothetical protein MPER_04069 [Moniliophthora perniciosa FA553]
MESDSIHIKRPIQDIHISSGGSGSSTPKKSVSWHNCQDDPDRCFEEIFIADDWDRTPMEPAQPLSYKDILELKAIQRTLPRAQQLPDPYTGKKPNHFLSARCSYSQSNSRTKSTQSFTGGE